MAPNDERFQQDRLDEQLAALAQTEGRPLTTPTSRAYHGLHQFHAAQAKQEEQGIERVRLRLAARAAHAGASQESRRGSAPGSSTLPPPAPARLPRHTSRLSVLINSAAAVLVVGLLVALFVELLNARSNGIAIRPATQSDWRVIPSPNTSQPINALKGITFSSSTDGWAVGLANTVLGGTQPTAAIPEIPLIEHWNGKVWQIASTPTLSLGGALFDVVSLAPDNAWAVGEAFTASGDGSYNTPATALIEHWDGRQWTVVPNPAGASRPTILTKLAALNADDIWAVGSSSASIGSSHGLIEHWDGRQWQIVPAPSRSADEEFNSISALAPDNIWAAGYSEAPPLGPVQTLIEHWDGTGWKSIPSPNNSDSNVLTGISALAPNDIWAAGVASPAAFSHVGPACCYSPLFEHWDGSTWKIVANQMSAMVVLSDLLALGPDDIWAVGSTWKPVPALRDPGTAQGLIEHWDGTRWSAVSNPHPKGYTALSAVANDPSTPGKLWAVGSAGSPDRAYDGLSSSTFIETN